MSTDPASQESHQELSNTQSAMPPHQLEEGTSHSLVDGAEQPAAEQQMAKAISTSWNYVFVKADLDTPAFFHVKVREGKRTISLNMNHPAYVHLIDILQPAENGSGEERGLQERLDRACNALKLILTAWADYENDQPDELRLGTQKVRTDWGFYARLVLEPEPEPEK